MSPLPPLLLRGDCLIELARIPDNSVDAVVTDPPYGLGFMGKGWDIHTPLDFERFCQAWATECLRILKPGGHMLAFGGSRTWHRLAAGIEDAGFEIRDSIAWLYGSGFPKSMDVSKAIDKLDAADERLARSLRFTAWMREHLTAKRIDEITGTFMGNHYTTHPTQPSVPTAELFDVLRPHLPKAPEWVERLIAEREVESANFAARGSSGTHREGITRGTSGAGGGGEGLEKKDVPHTDAAREWEGWGTALKPAFEPIVVARKPLGEKTVAANVLQHGTGALNIDATRIAGGNPSIARRKGATSHLDGQREGAAAEHNASGRVVSRTSPERFAEDRPGESIGRWPANVILDESQAAALDEQTGILPARRGPDRERMVFGGFNVGQEGLTSRKTESGGASRFFYVAKAPKSERPIIDGAAHPTVKPLAIMRWLIRLVTPPGGCVVDPFAGSGTTLEAAYLEGFESIGVEMTPDYWPLIEARIERVTS